MDLQKQRADFERILANAKIPLTKTMGICLSEVVTNPHVRGLAVFWNKDEAKAEHFACLQQQANATTSTGYHWRLLYAHAFTIGKLYLYVKRTLNSKERRYWVNTLMPIIFGAAHDPDQHPVWNYLYQERIALLIRFLPLLTENVNR